MGETIDLFRAARGTSRAPSWRWRFPTFARDSLAPYLRIRRLEFAVLPRTISGKIRRVELRGLEDEAGSDAVRRDAEYRYQDFPELRA